MRFESSPADQCDFGMVFKKTQGDLYPLRLQDAVAVQELDEATLREPTPEFEIPRVPSPRSSQSAFWPDACDRHTQPLGRCQASIARRRICVNDLIRHLEDRAQALLEPRAFVATDHHETDAVWNWLRQE